MPNIFLMVNTYRPSESRLGYSTKKIDLRIILSNQSARFHFLEFPSDFSLVDSIIDFKHYFSVPTPYIREMKKANYVCTVSELYREDISHRFASFLSRIGLPDMPKAKK